MANVALEPFAPNGEQLKASLIQFWYTVASITAARAQETGPRWCGLAAALLVLRAQMLIQDSKMDLDDEDDAFAAWAILMEMNYVSYRYRSAVSADFRAVNVEEFERYFAGEDGDPLSKQALDDIKTVKGSIEKILDKLPKPLKKIMEAIMEALQLTRGLA